MQSTDHMRASSSRLSNSNFFVRPKSRTKAGLQVIIINSSYNFIILFITLVDSERL